MIPNLSLLDTASAAARHAAHVHSVTARNIALADAPGATADRAAGFAEALGRFAAGEAPEASASRAPIVLDDEMRTLAQNAGRHDAAVTIYARVLDLVRLAGASPR